MISLEIATEVGGLIDRYGIPVVGLAFICFVLYKLIMAFVPWAKAHFDEGVKRHFSHLDKSTETQDKMRVSIERSSEIQERQLAIQERQDQHLERQNTVLATIHDYAKGLASGDQRAHWDGRFDEILEEIRDIKKGP